MARPQRTDPLATWYQNTEPTGQTFNLFAKR